LNVIDRPLFDDALSVDGTKMKLVGPDMTRSVACLQFVFLLQHMFDTDSR
jgi:hypothetical protein